MAAQPKCYDCGLPYGDERWIETSLPDDVWEQISPTGDENGLLCIACISARCKKLGFDDVPVILSGLSPLRQLSVEEAFDRGFKCSVVKTNQAMVREFHEKYGLIMRDEPVAWLSRAEQRFRARLLREEFKEYKLAFKTAHRAKEAVDILYILYGDALHHGFDLDAVFKVVHDSNMTKDGGKREDGKVLKGDGYKPPDIETVINSKQQEQPA